jgi:hypothetical protein
MTIWRKGTGQAGSGSKSIYSAVVQSHTNVGTGAMLEMCRALGQEALGLLQGSARTKAFLESQTIVPERSDELEEDQQYELVLNLNTASGRIEIKLGEELSADKRAGLFGFELMDPGCSLRSNLVRRMLRQRNSNQTV